MQVIIPERVSVACTNSLTKTERASSQIIDAICWFEMKNRIPNLQVLYISFFPTQRENTAYLDVNYLTDHRVRLISTTRHVFQVRYSIPVRGVRSGVDRDAWADTCMIT